MPFSVRPRLTMMMPLLAMKSERLKVVVGWQSMWPDVYAVRTEHPRGRQCDGDVAGHRHRRARRSAYRQPNASALRANELEIETRTEFEDPHSETDLETAVETTHEVRTGETVAVR